MWNWTMNSGTLVLNFDFILRWFVIFRELIVFGNEFDSCLKRVFKMVITGLAGLSYQNTMFDSGDGEYETCNSRIWQLNEFPFISVSL